MCCELHLTDIQLQSRIKNKNFKKCKSVYLVYLKSGKTFLEQKAHVTCDPTLQYYWVTLIHSCWVFEFSNVDCIPKNHLWKWVNHLVMFSWCIFQGVGFFLCFFGFVWLIWLVFLRGGKALQTELKSRNFKLANEFIFAGNEPSFSGSSSYMLGTTYISQNQGKCHLSISMETEFKLSLLQKTFFP